MTAELHAWIERFETARDELRDITREAHSSIKALKAGLTELEGARDQLLHDVTHLVEHGIETHVNARLEAFVPELKDHMSASVHSVNTEIEKIRKAIFIGLDGIDLRALADDLEAVNTTGKLPIEKKRKPSGKRVGKPKRKMPQNYPDI